MADNVARPHLLGLFRRASLDKTHDDHLLSTGCTSHPRSAVYSTLRASTHRCTCGRDARQLAPRLLFMHNTVGETATPWRLGHLAIWLHRLQHHTDPGGCHFAWNTRQGLHCVM